MGASRRCFDAEKIGRLDSITTGVLLHEPVRTLHEAATDRHDAPLQGDIGPAERKHFAPTCTRHCRKMGNEGSTDS